MNVVLLPDVLRQKLGEDGARELVNVINASVKSAKDFFSETQAEKIERRIAETRAELQKEVIETRTEIKALEARLTWKLFAFWVGQTAVLYGLIKMLKP